MKVLVVGNGGREHALAWALLRSPGVSRVFCAPGNGGTAELDRCENLPIGATAFDAIVAAVGDLGIDRVVVGPELPLSLGLVDRLRAEGIPAFGPDQAGAQIESSKAWAKALMAEAGIPTARSAVFTEVAAAIAYVREQGAPIVVKADGLAAGKGVTVAMSVDEAIAAIEEIGEIGVAGETLVIEDCMVGPELSVLALTDGKTIRPLAPAQDHKRIGEGDTGPNTGGMGAYAPAPLATPELMERIQREILEPTIAALADRGIDYRGILYAGLMITAAGPQVIEFNCRFGDPETQAILPLLETPLMEVIDACLEQRLAEVPIVWRRGASATVVMSAGGYPGAYGSGDAIRGISAAEAQGALVFQAGTAVVDGEVRTSGGRVLAVSAVGDDFDAAFAKVYGAIAAIEFTGCYSRRDIGYQVRSKAPGS